MCRCFKNNKHQKWTWNNNNCREDKGTLTHTHTHARASACTKTQNYSTKIIKEPQWSKPFAFGGITSCRMYWRAGKFHCVRVWWQREKSESGSGFLIYCCRCVPLCVLCVQICVCVSMSLCSCSLCFLSAECWWGCGRVLLLLLPIQHTLLFYFGRKIYRVFLFVMTFVFISG